MRIGFDLDKIFIDYPPFIPDGLINKLYKQKSNGMLLYRTPSKTEQLLRIFSHHYRFRPPIRENIEYVKKLTSRNNHKYYLISSRFSFLRKQTKVIVKKYGLDKIFDCLYFNFQDNQPHLFKNEIIKKLNINLYVDDDLQLLEHLCRHNPKVKFFWLNKKQNKTLKKNLFAIKNLSEMSKSNVHLRGVPQAQHHIGGGRRTPPR